MSALMMRIAGLDGYRELVKESGKDPDDLIHFAELESSWFDSADHLIPAWKACKLLEHSAKALDCPSFGLQLAQKQNLAILGPLGIMLQHSETLEHALQDLKRFLHVHSQAGNIDVSFSGNLVNISYRPLVSYQGHAKQLIDLSLALGFTILSGLSNRKFPLVSAYFSYAQPSNQKPYEDLFDCPLIYGATDNGVTISRSILEGSLKQNSDSVRGFLSEYLQTRRSALRPNIEESIRILVRQLLPLGKCKLEIISSALSIDKRTLQRRLKDIDRSFQSIVEEERKQIALKYMQETDMPLAQIADLLGYAEPSVFTRSFKSWYGLSPVAYIKQYKLRWKYQ